MPNWDQDRYWTGFFTTDPQLKKICKDFSRLVNFYRKTLLFNNKYSDNKALLSDTEELLAVMQHHDGITATSKTYIEDEFKKRMKDKIGQISTSINQVFNSNGKKICELYQNSNECDLRL